jgi:hypothetical protein
MAARELAERRGDGIVVRLYWDGDKPEGSDVFVVYRDARRGVYFTIYPAHDRVLDAFYHPNAYAPPAGAALPELRATG